MSRRPDHRPPLFTAGRGPLLTAVALTTARTLLGAGAVLVVGRTIDRIVEGSSITALAVAAGVLLALRAAVAAAFAPAANRTALRVETDLRRRVLDAVLEIGPWTGHRTGDVVGKATEGIDAVGALAGSFLPQLVGGMVGIVGLVAVTAAVDWPTGLVLLAVIPAIPVLLRQLERRFAAVSARYRRTADELAARFLDGIQGLPTLEALDRAGDYGERLGHDAERLRARTMALLRVNQLALLAVDTLFTLGTVVAAAAMAGWRLSDGAVTTGEATALVLLGVLLVEPLIAIGRFFYVGAIGRAAAAQVRELLALVPDHPEHRTREPVAPGTVCFDDVAFTYPDGTRALDRVTFAVEPGERVALVGPSGAGKTTIAHLVLGLLEPDRGQVLVGGRPVLVSQRPFLFGGSVAENLRLAAPGASDDELWAALAAADLADLIAARPGGLDAPVGERGLRLSGGEAQRLAVARALLVDASVVVLDEPTSNVDLETEARIRAAVDRLVAGRTVIVIAHRRSTIAGADRIVRVDRGTVDPSFRPARHGGGDG